MRFPTTSFVSRAERAAVAALLVLGTACYSFSGGGGLPDDVRTIFIDSFENTTAQFDLELQVHSELQERLPRDLGLRPGSEESADAVVRDRILRYDDRAQNNPINDPGRPLVHVVEIAVAVEIIDVKRNLILWESRSLTAQGEYRPDSGSELDGRRIAIEQLAQRILDGAQQQW